MIDEIKGLIDNGTISKPISAASLVMDMVKLAEQLKLAEEVIGFYNEPRNWSGYIFDKNTHSAIDPVDREEITDKWGDTEWTGGKRAREYFKNNIKCQIVTRKRDNKR